MASNNIFSGLQPGEIQCSGKTLIIDKNVYKNAAKCPSHDTLCMNILPIIDHIEYPVYTEIIEFIWCAGLPDHIVQKQYSVTELTFDKLPRYISIIVWCDEHINPSVSFRSFKSSVKKLIKSAIKAIWAIINISNDTRHSPNAYVPQRDLLRLFKSVGLSDIVPLPPIDNIVIFKSVTICHYVEKCYTESDYLVPNKPEQEEEYRNMYHVRHEFQGSNIKEVCETTMEVQRYIWKSYCYMLGATLNERMILAGKYWLKIDNFGASCAAYVNSILLPDGGTIYLNGAQRTTNISSIFMYGFNPKYIINASLTASLTGAPTSTTI